MHQIRHFLQFICFQHETKQNFRCYRYRKCLVEGLLSAASALGKAHFSCLYHQSQPQPFIRPFPHKALPGYSAEYDSWVPSGYPVDFIFSSAGYPSVYPVLQTSSYVSYASKYRVWNMVYTELIFQLEREGRREERMEGITLPRQIPKVEENILNKHGLTKKETKLQGPSLASAPSKFLAGAKQCLHCCLFPFSLPSVITLVGQCWNSLWNCGIWVGDMELRIHSVEYGGIHLCSLLSLSPLTTV